MKNKDEIKIVIKTISESSLRYNRNTKGRVFHSVVENSEEFYKSVVVPEREKNNNQSYTFNCITIDELKEFEYTDPFFYNYLTPEISRNSYSFYIFDKMFEDVSLIEGNITVVVKTNYKYGFAIPSNFDVFYLGVVSGVKEFQKKYEHLTKSEKNNIRFWSVEKIKKLEIFNTRLFSEISGEIEEYEEYE